MAKKRWIVAVLTLVLVLSIGGFLVVNNRNSIDFQHLDDSSVGETKNIPEGWKVYTHPNLGFKVAYPSGWFFSPRASGVIFSDDSEIDVGPLEPGIYPPRFINITTIKSAQTAEEYAESDLNNKDANIQSTETVQMSDEQGILMKSAWKNQIYLSAYVKAADTIFIFEALVSVVDMAEIDRVLRGMISTLEI